MIPNEYYALDQNEKNHWWFRTLHRQTLQKLLKYAPSYRVYSLLDAGCGTGGFLHYISSKLPYIKTVGIDVSALGVTLANKKVQNAVFCGSIDELPFGDSQFDVVVCHDVLTQQKIKPDKVISEFNRVLKRRGIIIINVAAFDVLTTLQNASVQVARRFSRKDIDCLFERDQWVIHEKFYWNTLLMLPSLLIRGLKKIGFIKMGDVEMTTPFLNKSLYVLLLLERTIFKKLPFMPGLSLYCIVQKR